MTPHTDLNYLLSHLSLFQDDVRVVNLVVEDLSSGYYLCGYPVEICERVKGAPSLVLPDLTVNLIGTDVGELRTLIQDALKSSLDSAETY